MPVLTINGRQVTVDDSFLSLPREEQDAAVEEIAQNLPSEKKEGSGVIAGAAHGVQQLAHGVAETAKQYFGVGNGSDARDPNYVPADPYKPSEWGQLVAENAPSMGAAIGVGRLTADASKALLKVPNRYAKLAGLAGAAAAGWMTSAGDTAKEAAAVRTGDPNAEPNTADKTRGGLTAAAANAVGALAPTRLIPGLSKPLGTVGAEGAADAAKRWLGTAAIGAGAGAASDAITQAGTTVGTDQGLTVDPNRVGQAAVTGGVTSGAMGGAPLAGDLVRSRNLREFGGANMEATKNYATRLQDSGIELGNAKRDASAHQQVVADLRNELSDAAREVSKQVPLTPDADNALQRAKTGGNITAKDVDLIQRETAGAPDGDNAAYLARTLRVAQLAQEKGSYRDKGWAGGISGTLEANMGYLLNPTRIVGGALATAAGMHLLGTSNPLFAGGVAGGYGIARAIDGLTGMRSPAQTFAQHFADRQAQLRMPTAQPPAPPAPPAAPQGPASPWGPRPPATGPTGPSVPPPAAPAPQPNISPMALAMLKQQLKAGLPPAPAPAAPPAPAPAPQPEFNQMALSMLKQKLKAGLPPEPAPAPAPAPAAPETPQISPVALKMLSEKLKAGLPAEPQAPVTPPPAAAPAPAAANPAVPNDVLGNTKKLMSAIAKVQKMKADFTNDATPASKITKSNGKVNTDGPSATRSAYEPFAEEKLYPKDISPEAYAAAEADAYLGPHVPRGRRETYMGKAEATARTRNSTIADLKAKFPAYSVAFDGLLRQLHKIGGKPELAADAVHHYADLLPSDVGQALREAFK